MQLRIDDLNKTFDQQVVLDQVQIGLQSGQIACLVGPSGCGKTTLLRCVAGFEPIDGGTINLNEELVSSRAATVAPEKRGIGMVFQDHSLFPHLTISQNIAFGLHQWSANERDQRIEEVLQLVGLSDLAQRYPDQMSGGQQQRAALARALAYRPKLLLMDEPFSSLDKDLRQRLASDVREILKQSQTTTLWVTHDQNEAMQAADVMGVMDRGHVLQWAAPDQIYHHPATRFVAEFLGECTFVSGQVLADQKVRTGLGDISIAGTNSVKVGVKVGTNVNVLVRANQIKEVEEGVRATIAAAQFEGEYILYQAELEDGQRLLVRSTSKLPKPLGQQVQLAWAESKATVFGET